MRTTEEIYQEMLAAFEARSGRRLDGSCDLAVRLYALAAQVQALECQAEWVLDQSFPQTAQGAYLDQHAAMRGITRQAAARRLLDSLPRSTNTRLQPMFVVPARGGLRWTSTQTGDAVSLFTARRTGAAGRNGNTVGTYMCADLLCAERVRTEIPPWLQDRNPAEVVAERAADLRERVTGFLRSVRA